MTLTGHPLIDSAPNSWPVATVNDIKSSERHACVAGPFGSSISAKYFVPSGVPIIRGSNLTLGMERFVTNDFAFISEETASKFSAQTVRAGDLVFTCWGTIGQVGLIPSDGPFDRYVISNKQLKLRVDEEVLDPLYAYYFFASPETVQFIRDRAIGAAVPGINLGILKALPVLVPPLETQRRIASILGAYDDLIEINRRRVAVLEEMARGLFEEWFVRFRFPGHEEVAIVDTPDGPLPEGWRLSKLEEVCPGRSGIQTGPFGSQLHQKDYAEEGIPVVMPKNIIDLRIMTDKIARIPPSFAESLGRHLMTVGDIVYGRRGDIGRRAFISVQEDGFFCGTGCLRLRADPHLIIPRYLFMALGTPKTEAAIKARATGATMPNLSSRVMKDVPVLLPSINLQLAFREIIEPLQNQISNLYFANRHLATSRDLLLPRLYSGKLSVHDAQLTLGKSA